MLEIVLCFTDSIFYVLFTYFDESMGSIGGYVKEICPRGNNKVVVLYFLIHDKCLLFMLELY